MRLLLVTSAVVVAISLLVQIPQLPMNTVVRSSGSLLFNNKNVARAQTIDPQGIVTHGSRDSKKIALTFDADMTPWMQQQLQDGNVKSYYGSKVIQVLEDTNTPATLFLTGLWIESYPAVAKQLGQNSLFELGNHTYNHFSFNGACFGLPRVADNQKIDEITKTQQLLQSDAGVTGKYFRFPGGCYSDQDLQLVHQEGLIPIQWDVVADDGFNDNENAIINNVISRTQNGSIIVMHMNGAPNEPETAAALPEIISQLKKKGFQFVSMSELLGG